MRRVVLGAMVLLLLAAGCGQEDASEVAVPIVDELAPAADAENSVETLDAEQADSVTMFQAAAKAYAAGRIEDAGFYLYAAELRGGVDMEVYIPVGTGGNSPGLLLAAMRQQVGRYVNPAIMRDRDAFGRVVDRITEWTPGYDEAYSPGWEYKSDASKDGFATTLTERKTRNVEQMRGFAKLMADDEYYRLFCTTQDYLNGFDILEKATANPDLPQLDPTVTEETYQAALERLAQIEEESGAGFGMFSEKLAPKRELPSVYTIEEGKVLHEGQILKGADVATFEILDERSFAKDRERVYLGGQVIVGADPATFRVLEGAYCRDASNVYCGTIRMDVSDVDEFEVVQSSDFWHKISGKDWFITLYGEPLADVEVSEQNPAITADGWGRDGVSYYFGPGRVKGADYDSFEVIDEFSAHDKNREYHGAHPTADTTR